MSGSRELPRGWRARDRALIELGWHDVPLCLTYNVQDL